MIKRIVEIANPAYIKARHKQLIIEQNGAVAAQLPAEDLGALILAHPAIALSQAVLALCQENKAVVVFCDARHLPSSVLLPLHGGHSLQQKVLQQQIAASEPVKKRLWQQIVRHKIKQQARTLELSGAPNESLLLLANRVSSGDKHNVEAQAAQKYWRLLFGADFRRDPGGGGINSCLNYGYALLRALVARSICASGLHPALGIHHHNQYNPLCLADDLMEPLRPWVDYRVWQLWQELEQDEEPLELEPPVKQKLLSLLAISVSLAGKSLPLMVACGYFIAQCKAALSAPQALELPVWDYQQ